MVEIMYTVIRKNSEQIEREIGYNISTKNNSMHNQS